MYRGGRAGFTSTSTRQVKADCAENQKAMDRLMQIKLQAEKNSNSNYLLTIRRAMKSLKECKTPITTVEEAQTLKYVGPRMAKLIIPNAEAVVPKPLTPPAKATSKASKPKNQPPATKQTTLTARGKIARATTKSAPTEAPLTAKQKTYDKAKQEAESLVLPTGPWKVILIIDGRERNSKTVVSRCKQCGIPCQERHLPIGDMAWIAQCPDPQSKNGGVLEVMCGTIIERKEVADLAASIFGTRFLEQRLRLQNSGLPQRLFLVEGDVNSLSNCPGDTLQMAMMESRVQSGFQVIQTEHMQGTVDVLKSLHRRVVQRTFPDAFNLPLFRPETSAPRSRKRRRRPTSLLELKFDTPPAPPLGTDRFITYPELKAKVERDREAGTRTIQAIYLAMLKQVNSVSDKKCQAIARQYPTLNSLLEAYHETDENKTYLVKDLLCGRQKVGPKTSSEMHIACCMQRNGELLPNEGGGKPPAARTVPTTSSTGGLSRNNSILSNPYMSSSQGTAASTVVRSEGCCDLTQPTPPKKQKTNAFTSDNDSSKPATPMDNYEDELQEALNASLQECSPDNQWRGPMDSATLRPNRHTPQTSLEKPTPDHHDDLPFTQNSSASHRSTNDQQTVTQLNDESDLKKALAASLLDCSPASGESKGPTQKKPTSSWKTFDAAFSSDSDDSLASILAKKHVKTSRPAVGTSTTGIRQAAAQLDDSDSDYEADLRKALDASLMDCSPASEQKEWLGPMDTNKPLSNGSSEIVGRKGLSPASQSLSQYSTVSTGTPRSNKKVTSTPHVTETRGPARKVERESMGTTYTSASSLAMFSSPSTAGAQRSSQSTFGSNHRTASRASQGESPDEQRKPPSRPDSSIVVIDDSDEEENSPPAISSQGSLDQNLRARLARKLNRETIVID